MERILFALALLPGAALADQRPCAAHDKIADALSKQYGEAAHAMGLAEDDTVMEIYASKDTGTWTLTVTMPNGMTCLVATGKNFETVSPTQVKGAPA
jgi:hypothetical protein